MARVLLSVSDKRGIVELARRLAALGLEVVATGGTAALVAGAGVPVRPVEAVTGFPEMLDGRVKTLHPMIHGGILARRDRPDDMAALVRHGIEPFDMVVVNLYPFRQTVAAGAAFDEVVEQIDIGGPSLVRAAAKNHAHVAVVVDPDDYDAVAQAAESGAVPAALRRRLAAKAFAHTAAYDSAVAAYMAEAAEPGVLPEVVTLAFEGGRALRYGENPHQRAAVYRDVLPEPGTVVGAEVLQGKELSYNNLMDADSAWRLCQAMGDEAAAVAVKHATPCGVALGPTLADAFARARDADPVAIFGGIVALNRTVDEETARALAALFLEVVVAPAFSPGARAVLGAKKNLRLLAVGQGATGWKGPWPVYQVLKIGGGVLLQERDDRDLDEASLRLLTDRAPSEAEMHSLRFAWRVVKHVRSNAIVLARDGVTTGIGGGQVSRVGAVEQAVAQAGGRAWGSVLASDAFFPMADGVETAARAGVKAIIQPGGSVKDGEVIDACNAAGIAMVATGIRHFRHS